MIISIQNRALSMLEPLGKKQYPVTVRKTNGKRRARIKPKLNYVCLY